MTRGAAVLALTLLLSLTVRGGERGSRTEIAWQRDLPAVSEGEAPKPLLVYVTCEDRHTRDQERFDEVVLANETFSLATLFFLCVDMRESLARAHPLFKDLEFSAPAAVVFDSTRKNRAVSGGRASAMKVYQTLEVKRNRIGEAEADGNVQKARQLAAEVEAEQAGIDRMAEKANARWGEIWDLVRRDR